MPLLSSEDDWKPSENKYRYFDIAPGMIFFDDLAPCEDLGMVESNRPNVHLHEFPQRAITRCCRRKPGSYSSIARDYNGTYSAQRRNWWKAMKVM